MGCSFLGQVGAGWWPPMVLQKDSFPTQHIRTNIIGQDKLNSELQFYGTSGAGCWRPMVLQKRPLSFAPTNPGKLYLLRAQGYNSESFLRSANLIYIYIYSCNEFVIFGYSPLGCMYWAGANFVKASFSLFFFPLSSPCCFSLLWFCNINTSCFAYANLQCPYQECPPRPRQSKSGC